jgi:hypothetical protein
MKCPPAIPVLPIADLCHAGLLHTIMFHRALGPTPPRDTLVERYNLTYVLHPSFTVL